MRKIAIVMESWRNWFTYAWASGMLRKIREIDEDVSIYIFNSSANWSSDENYTTGEYNIFNLPNFEEFDGVLLDLNNVESEEARQKLVTRVRKAGVPTIVIANHYDGFYSVGVHNYDAMSQVMKHLYNHHGCRKYWFIMGPSDHYENMRRDKAIWDYIAKKNIPLTDVVFHYGGFDTTSGIEAFNDLISKGTTLPDAIVCANDNIAVGVLSAAEKLGFTAPRDFLITGFDDLDKSRFYSPRISTVSYAREDIGHAAMEMFLDIWNGKQVPETVYTSWNPIFWESCGCACELHVDVRQHLKDTILYNEETAVFGESIMMFNDRLTHCHDIREMMACIPECLPSLRCDAMYLVADPNLVNLDKEVELAQDMSLDMMSEPFLTEGYPEDMRVVFAYDQSIDGDDENMEFGAINGIFPTFESTEKGANFLFLPIHFRDKCAGYIVIRNAIFLMDRQLLLDIVQTLTKNLEMLYKHGQLAKMNYVLTSLYNRDAMTMIYNRMGVEHVAEKFFRRSSRLGEKLAISYFDLDGLKFMNDTYGHAMGDFAIKKTAEIIQKNADSNKLVFRMGGDEFMAINKYYSDEEEEERCKRIQQEMKEAAEAEDCPVDLVVSYGIVVTEPKIKKPLADYILEADDKMYACKAEHKKQKKKQ